MDGPSNHNWYQEYIRNGYYSYTLGTWMVLPITIGIKNICVMAIIHTLFLHVAPGKDANMT